MFPQIVNNKIRGSSHPPIRSFDNVQRLQDFKINGGIQGPEARDRLLCTSRDYQIHNGQTAGFSEAENYAAVIKAIARGNILRTYLESKVFPDC